MGSKVSMSKGGSGGGGTMDLCDVTRFFVICILSIAPWAALSALKFAFAAREERSKSLCSTDVVALTTVAERWLTRKASTHRNHCNLRRGIDWVDETSKPE